ncbi:hypothetical protein GGF31_005643 [Allomyces arbusculus]|nr:hypothetical protein GGF31_005643 [Allomyces arbusculus]
MSSPLLIKDVEVADLPQWTADDDAKLRASLRKLGVPRTNVPTTFQIRDPDLRFGTASWDEVAKDAKVPGKSGIVCCFRFYGPMAGSLQSTPVDPVIVATGATANAK